MDEPVESAAFGVPPPEPPARLAILHSRAQAGVEAPAVTVEVLLSGGLPTFSIVGLAETAVRESKDRVRGAIMSSGFRFPQERIVVSLAPADLRKTGGRFDLAIALGILLASRQVAVDTLARWELYGELGLNGELRAVPGVLPAALKAAGTGRSLVVPEANGPEAALAGAPVHTARSLSGATALLAGTAKAQPLARRQPPAPPAGQPDLGDVKGQALARRALEIAAAGGHNLLLCGPPGTGKSMLARRLPGILPPMTETQALETAAIHSVLGQSLEARWRQRPFRAPHHTATAAALAGGGPDPRPGEVSRAHNGVLFLDELPEFRRQALEVLREPLESGVIVISRAGRQAEFPARFLLVAAMNPCPCGYLGDPGGDCRCSADRVRAYRNRISGPLLDRIDLQVGVRRLAAEALRPETAAEQSADVLKRVIAARHRQVGRAGKLNAALDGRDLEAYCRLDRQGWALLEKAAERLRLSARAHQRVRRVARSIADLSGEEAIGTAHLGEALGLRQLDRGYAGV